MGREAACICEWNDQSARVKALLESQELILRGEIRKRIPFSEIKRIVAVGDRLTFKFRQEKVCLIVGEALAPKWVKAISTPPPSLAKKLGIVPGALVGLVGKIDEDALREALAKSQLAVRGDIEVVVARVNTATELKAAFKKSENLIRDGVPVWIVYPKGVGHAISESDVRSTGLAVGAVDVKVAAVSPRLTALKFVARKTPRTN